jgi:hypothetical protein
MNADEMQARAVAIVGELQSKGGPLPPDLERLTVARIASIITVLAVEAGERCGLVMLEAYMEAQARAGRAEASA